MVCQFPYSHFTAKKSQDNTASATPVVTGPCGLEFMKRAKCIEQGLQGTVSL